MAKFLPVAHFTTDKFVVYYTKWHLLSAYWTLSPKL